MISGYRRESPIPFLTGKPCILVLIPSCYLR